MSDSDVTLTKSMIEEFQKDFEARPESRVAMNAGTNSSIQELALNRRVLSSLDWNFSHEAAVGNITAQKQNGVCWMFAALNWLRKFTMKKLNLESFEFSENYTIFWDKLEKANRFLEYMITFRDRELDDRHVHFLLNDPIQDGGEWHLLVSLIDKYGLVPKSAMADTYSMGQSKLMNDVLGYKLRQGASHLRDLHQKGKKEDVLRKAKNEILKTVYRMLVILLGEPPHTFDFAYRDAKKKFHRLCDLTPKKFFKECVGIDTRDYFWIMSCPLPSTPYHKTFIIDLFTNALEGQKGLFLNVPMETLHELALSVLSKKNALLFGCDVLQCLHRPHGILDTGLYNYDKLFGTTFDMDRATRMATQHMKLTHGMVFVGVDLIDDKPTKWKVENSWGEDVGKKGIFLMTDEWFKENVYSIVVHQKLLSRKLRGLLKEEPTVLPPWHPLG